MNPLRTKKNDTPTSAALENRLPPLNAFHPRDRQDDVIQVDQECRVKPDSGQARQLSSPHGLPHSEVRKTRAPSVIGCCLRRKRVNGPSVISGRHHEARDALVSVTATSRGYVGETGLGGGRRAGVVRERRGVRDRAFVAIRDKTNDSRNCGRIEAWLNR